MGRHGFRAAVCAGLCLCMCLLLCAPLYGCHGAYGADFAGGETLTPERLAELSAQVFGQDSTTEGDPDPADTVDPEELAFAGTVYWTEGGTVWHTDRDCYHIRNSEAVLEGSTDQAVAAGKKGLCASCRKRDEQAEQATQETQTEQTEGGTHGETEVNVRDTE